MLGLFTALDELGGIQTSGRLAWDAIRKHCDDSLKVRLLSYGNGESLVSDWPPPSARSKLDAVVAALRTRETYDYVLIWHIGLLKLIPFLRVRNARINLFLHGVECWGRSDLMTRRLLKHVDLFLSNSNHTWRRFLETHETCDGMPHVTVHLGAGTEPTHVTPPIEPPVILMLSRLCKDENYKGHREVIRALPLVLREIHNAQLWIVGDGNLKPALVRLVQELGLTRHVRFWGNVSDDIKDKLVMDARCLALPSRGEGFGLVYLEAQRVGRPCLVSRADAGMEVVNPPETGLDVDQSDPTQMANALIRLLSDGPEWAVWSSQAKSRYAKHFTGAAFERRLIKAVFENT